MFDSDEGRRQRHGMCHIKASSEVPCIFTALENASWADVRRALAANPSALRNLKTPANICGRRDGTRLLPIDYALHLCVEWRAVMEHCSRTGAILPGDLLSSTAGGALTLRERLAALSHIVTMLLAVDGSPDPSPNALHMALTARLALVARSILQKYPYMASYRAGASQKTALHLVAASACQSPKAPSNIVLARELLKSPDVSAADVDVDGRTPLHDLVVSISSASGYGLSSRSRGSLIAVAPLIDLLIANGALPCAPDREMMTPVRIAIKSLDYITLLRSAERVLGHVVGSHAGTRVREPDLKSPPPQANSLEILPDDMLGNIVKYLSPCDAVTGIGATSRRLRQVATREDVWRELLSMRYTLTHARYCIQQMQAV